MELGGKFEVEGGNGGERDEVLAKLNVETFLIIPPKVGSRIRNDDHHILVERNCLDLPFCNRSGIAN